MSATKASNGGQGVYRYALLGVYVVMVCLTGYPISSILPLKDLLVATHYPNGGTSHEMEAFNQRIGAAISDGCSVSVFAALVTGTLLDLLGPKVTGFMGQCCLLLSYVLMFMVGNNHWALYIGALLMGFSFIPIFTSKVSIASLFPSCMPLVLAVMGATPDISLFVPSGLEMLSKWIGWSTKTVITGYLAVLAGVTVMELVVVPMRPFDSPKSSLGNEDESPLLSSADSSALEQNTADEPEGSVFATVLSQVGSLSFILLSVFTGLNMFRKLYFGQLASETYSLVGQMTGTSIETVDGLKNMFKLSLPFAFLPALLMGSITNASGVVLGLTLQNTFGVALFVCASLPYMWAQYATVFFFNFMSSYVFGIVYAYLATFYGFRTMGILQGVQFFVAGSFMMGVKWYQNHVIPLLPSLMTSNRIIAVVCGVMYLFPLYVAIWPPTMTDVAESQSVIDDPVSADPHVRRALSVLGAEPFMSRKSYDVLANSRLKAS